MMAGKGPLPLGIFTDAVKEIVLPWSVTVTVKLLPESDPVTL